MKRKVIIVIVIVSILNVVFAESNEFFSFNTENDWYANDSAYKTSIPEGLTEREEKIYRAGYANGHYDALHPALVDGLYVINTKTKKFHLSNCPNTLTINTENRKHSTQSSEELINEGLSPCGQCHPENYK